MRGVLCFQYNILEWLYKRQNGADKNTRVGGLTLTLNDYSTNRDPSGTNWPIALMVRKMEDRASARVHNAGSIVGPTNSWSTTGGGGSVYGWDHSCPHWSTAGSDHSWSTVGRGHCSSHGHTLLPPPLPPAIIIIVNSSLPLQTLFRLGNSIRPCIPNAPVFENLQISMHRKAPNGLWSPTPLLGKYIAFIYVL